MLHYSFAIKLSPNDPILYSNRSFAFLKLKQLYYANEDAEKAIQLKPDWAKVLTIWFLFNKMNLSWSDFIQAHFRKAEVHLAAAQYDVSLLSYGRALQLQPSESILNAAKHCASLSTKQAYCKWNFERFVMRYLKSLKIRWKSCPLGWGWHWNRTWYERHNNLSVLDLTLKWIIFRCDNRSVWSIDQIACT